MTWENEFDRIIDSEELEDEEKQKYEYFDYTIQNHIAAQNGIFYGFDWSELFLAWGLDIEYYDNASFDLYDNRSNPNWVEDLAREYFLSFVWNGIELTRFGKKAFKDIKKFCQKMVELYEEEHPYRTSDYKFIWEGMSKIKDPFILFQFFNALLGLMWT